MRKGSLLAAILAVFTLECRPQVLAPPEILDPPMRALQQQHFAELKAAAVEITSHQYPFHFYLSRTLDLTEAQEQTADQRSIRFSNFQGQTVVQLTGNYFAAYSNETMNRNERVLRTYLDVVLPLLRSTAPRLRNESQLNAFAVEVSHHVRKKVLGVTVEQPENLALVIPRATAEKIAASNNEHEQVAALLESRVFIDGAPVSLWPQQGVAAAESEEPPTARVVKASVLTTPAVPAVTPPVGAPLATPARDISPEGLQKQQSAYQEVINRILHDLDGEAHFVTYAPPSLVAFHSKSYLQLSIATGLPPQAPGSQYRIAALAFDRHVSHLIRPLLGFVPKDPEFDGVVFSSTVRIPAKGTEPEGALSVEFFLSIAELRRFESYDITGQQLIDSGFILINGERVGLELQRAEADVR